ncbi:hypothetical protein [Jannaschia sp. LMIT008]|uniref:hypothetical protein n=1 Tax=Jannaschia maritima TaxID=3032585 RepID=UPI002810DBD8|nr:hypothetical protein [Jannaschia sp. LMIT008]
MTRVGLSALTGFLCTTTAFAYDEAAIIARCDAEWGTDFAMVAYCRKQQTEAGEAVALVRKEAGTNETLTTILGRCDDEWGTDYGMVEYCVTQQQKALVALGKPVSDVPPQIVQAIREQCDEDWGTDYSMVAYCVEQQTTAWRSLQ